MKKLILSSALVAGTSLGAGVIALPMVLCKIGIFPSILLISVFWFFMYLSGLLGLELNLRAQKGLSLGELGTLYSGPLASCIGTLSLMMLTYALLCAYLYGGASIFQSFLDAHLGHSFSLQIIITGYAFLLFFILRSPIGMILYINKVLLLVVLGSFGLLMLGLLKKINPSHIPLTSSMLDSVNSWVKVIPVLFTAFGFQVIFHTLTNFCDKDPKILKRAVFWGSLIPSLIYVIWTLTALGILYYYAPENYKLLTLGQLEVGQFIRSLADTASWPLIQALAALISIFAILKSSIGVGLGLLEAWQEYLRRVFSFQLSIEKNVSLGLTLCIPLMLALFVSELFLKAISFAGMILTIIAIFLPLWLINCKNAKRERSFYPLVQNKVLQLLLFIIGVVIVGCEILNISGV